MRIMMGMAGAVLLGMLCFDSAQAAQGIKEGRWSTTMVIRAEGMGDEAAAAMKEMDNMSPEEKAMMQQMMGSMGMGMQGGGMGMTTTTSQCLTNDNPVPRQEGQEDCQATHSRTGNTVNFKVVCPDGTSSGQVTYRHDSMKGTIQATQTKGRQQSNVTIDISGRYEGPCS